MTFIMWALVAWTCGFLITALLKWSLIAIEMTDPNNSFLEKLCSWLGLFVLWPLGLYNEFR